MQPPPRQAVLFLEATDPRYDPEWTGIYDHAGLPHGGGILFTSHPRETWTGTLDHGCIAGSSLHCFVDQTVLFVRRVPQEPEKSLKVIGFCFFALEYASFHTTLIL